MNITARVVLQVLEEFIKVFGRPVQVVVQRIVLGQFAQRTLALVDLCKQTVKFPQGVVGVGHGVFKLGFRERIGKVAEIIEDVVYLLFVLIEIGGNTAQVSEDG